MFAPDSADCIDRTETKTQKPDHVAEAVLRLGPAKRPNEFVSGHWSGESRRLRVSQLGLVAQSNTCPRLRKAVASPLEN